MSHKIVVTKDLKLYQDQKDRLERLGEVKYYNTLPKNSDEWYERCRDANIICTGIFGLKSDKLYELKDVFISLPFVGVEFIDKVRIKERNILISNAPGCNKEAVVEWMIGMTLMFYRRFSELNRVTTLDKDDILKQGVGLYNKKITILGTGNIGMHLGNVCESFGMKVKYFKRDDDLIKVSQEADIIANCLSSNDTTDNLLNKDFFFSLKKGALFISASRSKIYDIKALKEAINAHILIGAIDDAGSVEVGDITSFEYKELLENAKIFVTPHIAWNTDSESRKGNDMMIDNIEAWIKNKPINLI